MPPPSHPALQDESTLISRVKERQDSEALTTLVNANTGIYLGVVNRYAHVYPNVIKQPDLADDKLFNIYRFILDYNPDKGTKLSTWISTRTDYMCKEYLKRGERNPITSGTYGPGGPVRFDESGDTFTTPAGTPVTLKDEGSGGKVVEAVDRDMRIEDILAAAREVCEDKRFEAIIRFRFLGSPKVCLSWREIGEKLGVSHETCRKIYFLNLAIVKAHLAKTV